MYILQDVSGLLPKHETIHWNKIQNLILKTVNVNNIKAVNIQ